MGEPACWGPFVPALPLSMDATVSMTLAKSKSLKGAGGGEGRRSGDLKSACPFILRNCGPVPHDTWLPRKCSMCKCWHGQLRCFPQSFLPGCDGHVMDEHLIASRTPELTLSACALMLPGICLAIQSYYWPTFVFNICHADFMTCKGCLSNVPTERW